MEFFIPNVPSLAQADSIYQSIQDFVKAPTQEKRIYSLEWMHEGIPCQVSVGNTLPKLFHCDEPVLAIFDCSETLIKICTPTRGTVQCPPVYVDKLSVSAMAWFDPINEWASK